jgi:hypothetical protein
MTAILLALGSSVGYGVSDFLASRVAKRVAPVLLDLYSQLLQSVVLLVVVVAVDQPDSAAALGWGTAAGVVGAVGLVAYYQALATGQTAILAPPRLQRGRAAPAARPGPGGASRPGGPGRPGRGPGRGRRDRPGRRRGGRGGPAPTWHGPPATRRRAAVPRPPCRSCSPWSRRWPSGCSSSGSTWAAPPPAAACSGSPSASRSAPCPPPWSAPCGDAAGAAWPSTTRPCCGRWPC